MILTAALAWITWAVCLAVAIGVGLLISGPRARTAAPEALRAALWWGLGAILAILLAWNLILPLGGLPAAALAAGLVALAVAGWLLRRPTMSGLMRPGWILILLLVVLAAASIAMAFLALGTPLNYDTGLYHLGSIAYAHDFSTVPGLANLHDRFGFNSSMYPTAALLSNGIWSGEGFRLVNGLFLMAMAADCVLRFLSPRRRGAGDWVMLGATTLMWAFVLQVSGDRLASPTPDTLASVLVLTSAAYLTDALAPRSMRAEASAIALITAVLAATVRPFNWAYVAATVIVLLVVQPRWRRTGIIRAAAVSAILLLLMLVRDAVLSGWLLYPLNRLPVPVGWRTPDPQPTAEAITAWGRSPLADISTVMADSSWIGPWARRTLVDWSVLLLIVMLACWLVLFVRGPRRSPQYWAVVPAAASLPLWFVSAPDPRFAWGQILALGLVPLAIVLAQRPRADVVLLLGSTALLVASLGASVVRGAPARVAGDVADHPVSVGPLTITLALGRLPAPEMSSRALADQSVVTYPLGGDDRCWTVFPLCQPPYSSTEIARRGPEVADGFVPVR